MEVSEIKRVAQREPFRPFAIRLANGAEYVFNEPREFGAAKSFRTIWYFAGDEAVLIDRDSIVGIFEGVNGA